jgi:hypothetical protein
VADIGKNTAPVVSNNSPIVAPVGKYSPPYGSRMSVQQQQFALPLPRAYPAGGDTADGTANPMSLLGRSAHTARPPGFVCRWPEIAPRRIFATGLLMDFSGR